MSIIYLVVVLYVHVLTDLLSYLPYLPSLVPLVSFASPPSPSPAEEPDVVTLEVTVEGSTISFDVDNGLADQLKHYTIKELTAILTEGLDVNLASGQKNKMKKQDYVNLVHDKMVEKAKTTTKSAKSTVPTSKTTKVTGEQRDAARDRARASIPSGNTSSKTAMSARPPTTTVKLTKEQRAAARARARASMPPGDRVWNPIT